MMIRIPVLLFLSSLVLSLAGQDIAFTLPEADLIPECIGWSEKQKSFYITSIHKSKIVRYNTVTREYTDFITTLQDGYDTGIGLIVDDKRGRVWSVCGWKKGDAYIRGIFAWDIETGALLHRYMRKDLEEQMFNDLALDKSGNVYVSDTYSGKVFWFNVHMAEPIPILTGIPFPNGIVFDGKRSLYIASHTEGIVKADVRTKELIYLEHEQLLHTGKGLDGLKYHKGSLIGVFNASRQHAEQKVIRYRLNQKRNRIETVDILDAGHPHFIVPTTGVVVKDMYYLIANSCLDLLDQDDNTILDPGALVEPVIMRYDLRKK